MDEGEHADHVIVILSGWTKICLHGISRRHGTPALPSPGRIPDDVVA
jgi:hypothetical protein